jgi:hypothetical protein
MRNNKGGVGFIKCMAGWVSGSGFLFVFVFIFIFSKLTMFLLN